MSRVRAIVGVVKATLPQRRPIEHHEAFCNGREVAYLKECVESGVVGYKFVKRFEEKLSEICGVPHVVAMASGTAALHIALLAAGVKKEEEVLLPALTFAATANAVVYAGAVPHFIDTSFNLVPFKLRQYLGHHTSAAPDKRGRINIKTGRKITTLIVVHLLGWPARINELIEVASQFGLQVIEDAAESLGSRIGNAPCGSFGVASVLSFNNNKIVTTNGGGALLTSDPWIAAKAFQLSTTARIPHPWLVEHDEVAYNYRMPQIAAAIGLAQLEQLNDFVASKDRLAGAYRRNFLVAMLPNVYWNSVVPYTFWNCWLNSLRVEPKERDAVLKALHDEGIKARALFTPLHMLPMYRDNPRSSGNMIEAEDTFNRTICLPSGVGLA